MYMRESYFVRSSKLTCSARAILAMVLLIALAGCTGQPTIKDIPGKKSSDAIVHCTEFEDGTPFDSESKSTFTEPKEFRDDSVAHDIVRARQHVNRMRRCYEFLGDYAGRKSPLFDVPLLGVAMAGAGAILYRANADVVGGFGLAAGGLSATKLYYHPAPDQQAFLAAEKQLMCIYDYTHVTRFTLVGDILANDRILLQTLVEYVNSTAGPLLTGEQDDQTKQQKAVAKAVQDSTASAKKALDAIEAAIADYRQTPSAIYDAADRVDFAARDSTRLSIAYSDAVSAIQGGITTTLQNKSTVADARQSLLKAQASSGAVAKTAGEVTATAAGRKVSAKAMSDDKKNALRVASSAVDALTSPGALPKSFAFARFQSANLQTSCAPSAKACTRVVAGLSRDVAGANSGSIVGTNEDKGGIYQLRAFDSIEDQESDAIAKLIAATDASLNDIPDPAYSEVRTNIAKCVVGAK